MKIFVLLYRFIYLFVLKVFYKNRVQILGRVSSNGFFKIEVARNAKLIIEGNITLSSGTLLAVRKNAFLSIGEGCFFNRNCSVVCREKITIGHDCLFGESVRVYDSDHLIKDGKVAKDAYKTSQISIGNACWIANDVNVLRGSLLLDNTVIGAMSLVNRALEVSGIYAGIPVGLKKKH